MSDANSLDKEYRIAFCTEYADADDLDIRGTLICWSKSEGPGLKGRYDECDGVYYWIGTKDELIERADALYGHTIIYSNAPGPGKGSYKQECAIEILAFFNAFPCPECGCRPGDSAMNDAQGDTDQ